MSRRNKAIILELGVNGLGVVRSLANKGIDIIGIHTEEGPGCFSKYCNALAFPKISEHEDIYKRKLIEICESMRPMPVIFPTNDRTVSFLSKHRKILSPRALFALPEEEVLGNIINKDGTKRLASECGIKIPTTYLARDIVDLQEEMKKALFPIIYKPRDTFSVQLPHKEKNLTFQSKDELIGYFEQNPEYISRGVFQEVIWGGDGFIYVCAGYFNENSDALALYTGRKIRQYLPDYGITSCGESLSIPELAEMTVNFMKATKYKGLAAIEYVKDRRSGDYYFLEINARSYYHNSLFLSCGVNLPHTCYLDLTGRGGLGTGKKLVQKDGIIWIDFNQDLASFLIKHRKHRIDFSEWLPTVLKAKSFAVFDSHDIKPFLYNTKCLFGFALAKLRKKVEIIYPKTPSAPVPPSP